MIQLARLAPTVRLIVILAIGDGREFKMEQPIPVKGKILVVKLKIVMTARLRSDTVKFVMRATS